MHRQDATNDAVDITSVKMEDTFDMDDIVYMEEGSWSALRPVVARVILVLPLVNHQLLGVVRQVRS